MSKDNGSSILAAINAVHDGESVVRKLLSDFKAEGRKNDYSNWPLKDVPFEVIWNNFSRSGIRLDPDHGN